MLVVIRLAQENAFAMNQMILFNKALNGEYLPSLNLLRLCLSRFLCWAAVLFFLNHQSPKAQSVI